MVKEKKGLPASSYSPAIKLISDSKLAIGVNGTVNGLSLCVSTVMEWDLWRVYPVSCPVTGVIDSLDK